MDRADGCRATEQSYKYFTPQSLPFPDILLDISLWIAS